MAKTAKPDFDPKTFLATVNGGRSVSNYRNHQTVFSQGDPADAVFYIQEGRAKVCVISERGKEAVVALHKEGDFFGEGCLSGQPRRLATVAALTKCVIMRIEKATMVRVLHEEPAFSEMFLAYLLARNARAEEDLVDQLFNSSEKRLARLTHHGEFRQGGKTRAGHREDQPRDARRNDRHYSVAREPLHEQVSQARVHRVQRHPEGPYLPAQYGPA